MLGVYIFDDKGNIVCFEKPLSLTVDMSLTVPCDIATVVLPYKNYTDGAEIKIYNPVNLSRRTFVFFVFKDCNYADVCYLGNDLYTKL